MKKSVSEIQKKQQKLGIVIVSIMAIGLVYFSFPFGETPKKNIREESRADVPFLIDNPDALSVRKLMVDVNDLNSEKEDFQKTISDQKKEVDSLKFKLDQLADSVALRDKIDRSHSNEHENAINSIKEIQEQFSSEINELKKETPQLDEPFKRQLNSVDYSDDMVWDETEDSEEGNISPWTIDLLTSFGAQLSEDTSSIHNGVIAGTTVKAILLNGITASFGPCSVEDPVFVKLRIMDESFLPKELKTEMKDAYLIGAAYGDLSTERVRVRVEKLVVFRNDGSSEETNVIGVITDEWGQNGLSGCIVDRSPKILQNAATAGLFEGASNFLSATVNSQNLVEATKGLPNSSRFDLIREGGLSGGSRAMERIADYYGFLLENYHPYISVDSGRIVDVTFLATSRYGSTDVNLECAQVRDRSKRERRATVDSSSTQNPSETRDTTKTAANDLLKAYGLGD